MNRTNYLCRPEVDYQLSIYDIYIYICVLRRSNGTIIDLSIFICTKYNKKKSGGQFNLKNRIKMDRYLE